MRLMPQSLFGRLILLLLTGLVLAQLLSAFVLLRDRGQVLFEAIRENLIERTAGIVHLIDSLNPKDRLRLLPLLTTPELRIDVADRPTMVSETESKSRVAANIVKEQLSRQLSPDTEVRVSLEGSVMEPRRPPMHRRHMRERGPTVRPWAYVHGVHAMARSFHIQVRLGDGSWIKFERGIPAEVFDWPYRLLIVLGILLVSVVGLSLMGVRSIVRPLRKLRTAAEGLGKDIGQSPLPETGPTEIRETAKAFNTMQQRLSNYIGERARILAAVSHDLKTPLTRIRLRTDLMDDEESRTRIQSDLDEMETMVSATLDFMRGTESKEKSLPLDLVALLESIRDDAVDSGDDVRLEGRIAEPYQGRPLALKRCIGNLVQNAMRYGGDANIAIEESASEVIITVSDSGPGIPEDALEKVFDPFFRVESSRARDTGGTGLGLGIARNIARAHGGELLLRNRPAGGLEAQLHLPR